MKTVFAIGLGGAVGAIARHFLTGWLPRYLTFNVPLGILIANVIGSLLMGLAVTYFIYVYNPPLELKAFITVGLLGGFTTFSTFSLEAGLLIQRGQYMETAGYIAASVLLSIMGLFFGMWLGKNLI